jgi:FkbM family methyltransferase
MNAMVISLIKKAARLVGAEVHRYNPTTSDSARMRRIFDYQEIDLILDVGANTGQYACFVRKIGYQGRIVSFEPQTEAYGKLVEARRNDRLWEIAPQTAIGDRNGQVTINLSKNSVSSSILPMLNSHRSLEPESVYASQETVEIRTLDTIAAKYLAGVHSVYLKIDVQGYEKNVLLGATSILPKIKGIQIEMSLLPLYDGELLFKDMIVYMEHLGYDLYALIPGFTDNNTGRLLQVDGVFFRKSESNP